MRTPEDWQVVMQAHDLLRESRAGSRIDRDGYCVWKDDTGDIHIVSYGREAPAPFPTEVVNTLIGKR